MSSEILAFLGGLSVSIITLIGNWVNQHYETKKAYRLSVMDSAFKEYEMKINLLKEQNHAGKEITIFPWDMYVVSYGIIFKYLQKRKIKAADVEKMLKDMKEISTVYRKHNNINS